MNEKPPESPVTDKEHEDEDAGQSPEKKSEAADPSEAAQASEVRGTKEKPSSDAVEDPSEEKKDEEKKKEEAKAAGGEPPVDWFEPLEEDEDATSEGGNDPEEESVASEKSAGGEKAARRYRGHAPRRKRTHPDEGWVEWPVLGEGWKRKEVVRRSGCSIGQKDVYYISPRGERVRSRVELLSVMDQQLDLTGFDYKSGKFLDGEAPPVRVRHRAKRKFRERSSSESSMMDRGEGADTPDSHHRLTPSVVPKTRQTTQNQASLSLQRRTATPDRRKTATPDRVSYSERPKVEEKIRLPPPSMSSKPLMLPAINGEIGTEESTLVCSRCGIPFTGTWYDRQRKRPCCPSCWAASKTKEHPMIRFRKWIPCGQCVGCHNTINCGQCANCKHGLQSPESRKRLCRKRRCICPIRKGTGSSGASGSILPQKTHTEPVDTFDDSMSFQSEAADSQPMSLKSSDTENFSVNVDVDDDEDMSTDDDDDWHKKRKRRSCGECKACLCRKDCGTCDFCIDKPKFGGSNKKRQKCRLRQCQRQAMRHLLPFQMGQSDFGPDGPMLPGRPRPHYTYSRKPGFKKNKGPQFDYEVSDDDEDSSFPPMSWSSEPASGSKNSYDLNVRNNHSSMQLNYSDVGQRNGLSDRVSHVSNHNNAGWASQNRWSTEGPSSGRHGQRHDEDNDEEEEFPMITQIFSLADNGPCSGADADKPLIKLLNSLRTSVLPILWHAIMVDGPQLQIIQCSKQSHMADTTVLIDPDFCFQITVQKQPLLPTHQLYDSHPTRLSSVTDIVSLLLGLEHYVVCQGLPHKEPLSYKDPIVLERASTCDFLVGKNERICAACRELRGL